jgi:hypothetical protein
MSEELTELHRQDPLNSLLWSDGSDLGRTAHDTEEDIAIDSDQSQRTLHWQWM